MSTCNRASVPTTHPALTPLGFRNLLNFPLPGAPRRAPRTKWHGGPPGNSERGSGVAFLGASEHLPEARAAIPCGSGSDPRPERQFRARLPPIPGQNGNSVRDCRRSQAKTAILRGSGDDPRPERQFRAGGVERGRGALNRSIQSRPPWFRVLLIHRALPRGRV